ncbi:MAG: ABC transporter substrate-binding protein [Bacteroidetes bacterium]|nr:ABC transporter substrate-binding protein [Bacteroidota bacterium]
MRASIHVAIVAIAVLTLLGACAPVQPTTGPTKPSGVTAPTAAAQPSTPAAAAPAAPTAAPTSPAAPKIKRGGTLRVGDSFTVTCMDPQICTGYNAPLYVMYETLLKYQRVGETSNFELAPDLAESWQIADPKTIVLKLRKGVKFHDGSDWNADVAKWNIDRWLTNPKFAGKVGVADFESAEVVDPYTLKLHLKQPSAPALFYLTPAQAGEAGKSVSIVSKAAVEKLGEQEFGTHPAGTGPMQFVNWLRDDNITLKRFDQYWRNGEDGKPLPYVDGFVWRFKPDVTVAITELRTGALDVTYRLPIRQLETLRNNPDLVVWDLPWAFMFERTEALNVAKGTFKNQKLRQAAWYALDRAGIAKGMTGGAGKPYAYPLWPPSMLGYDDSLPRYDYNPDKARQLVKDAGYPNGVDVEHLIIAREPDQSLVQAVKQSWDAAGLRTTVEPCERTACIQRTRAGDFEAYAFGTSGSPEPDTIASYILPGGANNRIGYDNPDVTSLMSEARSTYDSKQRADIYKKVQQILFEDAPYGTTYLVMESIVFNKAVKGLKVQFTSDVMDYDEVWLDK